MKPGLPTPASALAIVAHPDDAEFQCGATLAKWARAGTVVHHLVCTDGSKGTWDPDCDQDALVTQRQAEQREAARRLGATGDVVFLGAVDGELDSGVVTRSAVARHIRRLAPEVVLGHDPWKRYRLHPDHRHAGLLAVEGIVAARDPFFFPDHDIAHHRPEALLLFEADEADQAEAVEEGDAAAQVDALLAHTSQFVTTHDITDPDDEAQVARFADRVHGRLHRGGARAGVERAELYKAIVDL